MSVNPSIKQLGEDLWENKPLFITTMVGLAIVIYIIWKKGGGSSNVVPVTADPAAVSTVPNSGGSGTFVEESYYVGPTTTTNNAAPIASPIAGVTADPILGTIVAPVTTILTPMPSPTVQPPKLPPTPSPATLGLLGPKVQITQKNGVYVYKKPDGQQGTLSNVLPHGAGVRGGSNGRWWYILNGLKYLITSGNGGPVMNNGTDANAP